MVAGPFYPVETKAKHSRSTPITFIWMTEPTLSLVVLAWDNLELTRRCVETLRAHTDVSYELIIVDNGSTDGGEEYAKSTADIPVLNGANLGFARGMNKGLAEARGDLVAFINNDTAFPEGWASTIVQTLHEDRGVGIAIPAVTAAGNPVTVRGEPGTDRIVLAPFGEFPSGVVYVMPTTLVRALGGWNEAYAVASSEDLDLAFTVWAHGLQIVLDERVLVEHVSQASVRKLPNRKELYRSNLTQFLDRWESCPLGDQPLIDSVPPEDLMRNQERAMTAVIWIRRMLAARDEAQRLRSSLKPALQEDDSRRGWFRSRS